MSLEIPYIIHDITKIPKDEIHVKNGINQITGYKQPDEIKDWLSLSKGKYHYSFALYYSENAAKKIFNSHKEDLKDENHIFSEIDEADRSYCIQYINQPRSDPEGGHSPSGYYNSGASFRLRNLIIDIGAMDREFKADTLQDAISFISAQLSDNF
jgi:hypothetical protein